MSLPPSFSDDRPLNFSWDDLQQGAPTIVGFAALCSRALANDAGPPRELSQAAKAILFAARARATIELKASKNAYDSSQRLLAVHVELAPARLLAFRSRGTPHFTLEMLEGFRELCAAGLVLHHLGSDFAVTHEGLRLAASIEPAEVAALLEAAAEEDFDSQHPSK
jgi:hypothetical protein